MMSAMELIDVHARFLTPRYVPEARPGASSALAEATLTDDAGRIYATATSSCLIMRPA